MPYTQGFRSSVFNCPCLYSTVGKCMRCTEYRVNFHAVFSVSPLPVKHCRIPLFDCSPKLILSVQLLLKWGKTATPQKCLEYSSVQYRAHYSKIGQVGLRFAKYSEALKLSIIPVWVSSTSCFQHLHDMQWTEHYP